MKRQDTNTQLRRRILMDVANYPDEIQAYEDFFSWCREEPQGRREMREFRPKIVRAVRRAIDQGQAIRAEAMDNLNYRALAYVARDFFDEYLQAVEYHRRPEKQFYLPRRGYLKRYVDAYQRVLDGEIRFLSISMPKRCGKSQLGINFTMMVSGRNPNGSTLMEGAGDALVKSFYNGCLEYLAPPYNFKDIFPDAALIQKDSALKTLNLVSKSRFPTIMCRSVDASQVGLSEATNLLYLDDTVESHDEAKNQERLNTKWETISGDVLGRAIPGTPIVICGTRYSIYDPIQHLQDYHRDIEAPMEIIEIPALDPETDESNFEHTREGGRVVFSTQYFREQRKLLTPEQFEAEFQQAPFESRGTLFPKKDLMYFEDLPDSPPDSIIAVCDTAEDGEDYTSMVVAAIYDTEAYIIDVVYDNSSALHTKPECASAIIRNMVSEATFEINNAGKYYSQDVEKILTEQGYQCGMRTVRSLSKKTTRIEFAADNIIKHFHFKLERLYDAASQYGQFMRAVWGYVRSGKVIHDDAPDSLAILEGRLRLIGLYGHLETFDRPF